jgi:hypothetical protein
VLPHKAGAEDIDPAIKVCESIAQHPSFSEGSNFQSLKASIEGAVVTLLYRKQVGRDTFTDRYLKCPFTYDRARGHWNITMPRPPDATACDRYIEETESMIRAKRAEVMQARQAEHQRCQAAVKATPRPADASSCERFIQETEQMLRAKAFEVSSPRRWEHLRCQDVVKLALGTQLAESATVWLMSKRGAYPLPASQTALREPTGAK